MVLIYIPHTLNYITAKKINVFTPLHFLNPPEYKTVKKNSKRVKSSIEVQTIFSLTHHHLRLIIIVQIKFMGHNRNSLPLKLQRAAEEKVFKDDIKQSKRKGQHAFCWF